MVLPELLSIPDRPAKRRSSRAPGVHGAPGHLRPRPRARLAGPEPGSEESWSLRPGAPPRPGVPSPPRPAVPAAHPRNWRAPARRGLGRLPPPPPPPPPPQLGPFKRPQRGGRAGAGSSRGCVTADWAHGGQGCTLCPVPQWARIGGTETETGWGVRMLARPAIVEGVTEPSWGPGLHVGGGGPRTRRGLRAEDGSGIGSAACSGGCVCEPAALSGWWASVSGRLPVGPPLLEGPLPDSQETPFQGLSRALAEQGNSATPVSLSSREIDPSAHADRAAFPWGPDGLTPGHHTPPTRICSLPLTCPPVSWSGARAHTSLCTFQTRVRGQRDRILALESTPCLALRPGHRGRSPSCACGGPAPVRPASAALSLLAVPLLRALGAGPSRCCQEGEGRGHK
ncbi:hypothetical protein HPG69_007591 [Diceros bicornis minor]|uniref:Uncharacterized protein n=1 Tax=Diceros bicornis minor TaxID=77932 RepID=A0A7J7EVH6_DICBM|nr:hypothetical protein HPG69_007591 [Diceros bicornis minor]